ncbi:hypothetical protein IFM89_012407, partial [Coptis chinensis]
GSKKKKKKKKKKVFSQFDGNAAFSGGGFMPSQSFQSTDPGYSSSSKSRDSQVLLPFTVKQIKDASNPNDEKSNIVIDGVDVNNVNLSNSIFFYHPLFFVTDIYIILCFCWLGWFLIELKGLQMFLSLLMMALGVSFATDVIYIYFLFVFRLNENIDSKEMEQIQDGMYIRVHGALKVFQGKIQLNTFSIRYAIHELIKLFECKCSLELNKQEINQSAKKTFMDLI